MITHCLWCNKKLPKDSKSWHRKYCCRLHQNKYIWRRWIKKHPQKKWRKYKIKNLDKNPKCFICNSTKKLNLHHIRPIQYEGKDVKNNIIILCKIHHKLIHKFLANYVGKRINFERAFNNFKHSLVASSLETTSKA